MTIAMVFRPAATATFPPALVVNGTTGGGGPPPASDAGAPVGLLLTITKAS
jgi:hypothetical protein